MWSLTSVLETLKPELSAYNTGSMIQLKTIRTIVYPASDLEASIAAWSKIMGKPVYKNKDFATFVGEDGIDIRLNRIAWADQPITFWEVEDIEAACSEMVASGAAAMHESEHGGLDEIATAASPAAGVVNKPGRKLAIFRLADSNFIGLLQDL